jgi:predicted phage terminase large subunit-like protein
VNDDRALLRAYVREDLSAFVQKCFVTLEPGAAYKHNWHIDHLCWQLERVARGEVRRLIINVPPRSMKSITVSVGFTAWLIGHDPTKRIMCVSYAEDLARKLAGDAKLIMDEDWYRDAFPRLAFTSKRPRLTDLKTTQQGYRYAAGMNGAILGRGADVIVIDDPIKPSDALSAAVRKRVNDDFDMAVYTRLNNKISGAIVIIMQRLHEDDLVGHVMARDDWEVVSLPATAIADKRYQLRDRDAPTRRPPFHDRRAGDVLHPAREPLSVLELNRRVLGSLVYSAQYQQAPTPVEGNIVRREWIRTYGERPDAFDFKIASWDTASTLSETADFSVGQVWGVKGLDFYLLDSVRGRFEMPELRRQVVELSRRHHVDLTVIENTETGRALKQDLRHTGALPAVLQKSTLDKEARFLAQSARFEAGQVHVPKDAPWLAEWMDELLSFPNARHDDQVDATSQALNHLTWRAHRDLRRLTPKERPKGGPRPAGSPFRRKRID